jgi:transposase
MTKEEELQAFREENRVLRALVAEPLPLKEQVAQANARIKDLEDRLAKDSRTSSKPPSSDGLARLPCNARRPGGKRPGGQAGHPGHTLSLVELPDEVVCHRPKVCRKSQCGPQRCPRPRRRTPSSPGCAGNSPPGPRASDRSHLLPNLQALAVYLHQGQLLPTARTCEALTATCGCQLSEGTRLPWSELAAERLAPTFEPHGRTDRCQSAPAWR